jgi:hypothetical protein
LEFTNDDNKDQLDIIFKDIPTVFKLLYAAYDIDVDDMFSSYEENISWSIHGPRKPNFQISGNFLQMMTHDNQALHHLCFKGYNSIAAIVPIINNVCTMRSARNNTWATMYEIIPEWCAQYFVTGKVTLNEFPEQITWWPTGYPKQMTAVYNKKINHIEIENMINDMFSKLANWLPGKALEF